MGYTHYFAYDPADEQFRSQWDRIVIDAGTIAMHAKRKLGIETTGDIMTTGISVNGPAARDHAGGAVTISRDPWEGWAEEHARGYTRWAAERRAEYERNRCIINFCATGRRPYDTVAAAILLRARYHAPHAFKIGSDGTWALEWHHGANHHDGLAPAGPPSRTSAIAIVAELFEETHTPYDLVLCRTGDLERHGCRAVPRLPASERERAVLRYAEIVDTTAETLPAPAGEIVLSIRTVWLDRFQEHFPDASVQPDPDDHERRRLIMVEPASSTPAARD
jgi:hypothetical protein